MNSFFYTKKQQKSFPRSAPGCACRAAAPLACMAAVHAGHEATAKQLPAHAGALTGQNPAGFRPFLFQTAAVCNRAAIALPGLRRRAKESVRNRPDQFVIARNQPAIAQNQPGGRLSKGRCAPRRLTAHMQTLPFPAGPWERLKRGGAFVTDDCREPPALLQHEIALHSQQGCRVENTG